VLSPTGVTHGDRQAFEARLPDRLLARHVGGGVVVVNKADGELAAAANHAAADVARSLHLLRPRARRRFGTSAG